MTLATIDELTVLAERIYRETEDLPKAERKKKIADEVLEVLILAYVYGYRRVDEEGRPDTDAMYEAIYLLIDGETYSDRISKHIENGDMSVEVLQRIIETEYHRVEETGAFDSAKEYERKTGKTAYKKWVTMRDDRVRETHFYLEGTEVLLTGRFYTYDDDSAEFPGGFSKPENNCNCRCELAYVFR